MRSLLRSASIFVMSTALSFAAKEELQVTAKDRQHWSFRPLSTITPPLVKNTAWIQTPVDSFILHALERNGLAPAPPADARTLARRLSFDLTGLPPAQSQISNLGSQIASLLTSPHHAERWARHWLDIARYADSNGQESDHDRPNAFRYRDFVIRALQDDMPYDQFVRWQLAGDELAPDDAGAIAATGFIVAGVSTILDVPMQEEKLRLRADELDDMVSTTGQALLGLTLSCARCHDHKYDPIPTRDYYRLTRVFNAGDRTDVPLAPLAEVKARRAKIDAWQREYDAALKQREKDEKRVKAIEKRKPAALPAAFAFADFSPEPRETWFSERGNSLARNEKMELGFLSVLTGDKTASEFWKAAQNSRQRADSTQQRTALAHWITDTQHGAGALLARVMVNRVWQHHFGEGLVRTVSDFGTRGELPTHPELLEWLAADFVKNGWSLRHLHRVILHSAAYQQSTAFDEKKNAVDPENRLLWRRRPMRLEAEALRDAMLSAAGTLNHTRFGPSVKPPIALEAMQARNVKNPYPKDIQDSVATRRRSLYLFHKRVVQQPLLQAFDAPDAGTSCGRRMNTTVAPQALALLNDPFVRLRASELAARIHRESASDSDKLVRRAFQLCLSREPAAEELAEAVSFIRDRSALKKPLDAVADFCQTLFGLNEFIYID